MLSAFPVVAAETAEGSSNPPLLIPEPYDIIWSAVIFVVVLAFFLWRVLPKLNATLDARADAIEGGIKRAEEAEAKAAAALEANETQLAEARAEAAKIREQARGEGQQILAELKQQAQEEANRIAETARTQIEAERQSALQSLRREVGTLAVDLSERVVGESLDAGRSASIVDRFLADLESEEAGAR